MMNEAIKEIKASHLGYIQEKLDGLVEDARDKKRVIVIVDDGVFKDKERHRINVCTNDSDMWNEFIYKLVKIDELAIKDRLVGYTQQQSIEFYKDKETRFYVIILNTDKYSLYYNFAYRTGL